MFGCGEIVNNSFVEIFQSPPVEEFWKFIES